MQLSVQGFSKRLWKKAAFVYFWGVKEKRKSRISEENMKNSANDVTADSGYFFIKVWEDKVSSLATFF